MNGSLDLSRLAEQLAVLRRRRRGREAIALVVPLAEGRSEVVREFLEEGPPFDPREVGLSSHRVFLTEREVVFVFESEEGPAALERILAEPEVWEVAPHWQHHMAGEPRVGLAVFEWSRQREAATA